MRLNILLSIFSIFIMSLVSCSPELTEQKQAIVFIKEIQSNEIFDVLQYPARIVARVHASLLSEKDGVVGKIFVFLGKKVKFHQSLMELLSADPVYQFAPLQVVSPITGVVSSINVTEGSHVVRGQKIGSVIDPSQIEVHVEIPGQDLIFFQKKIKGELKISSQNQIFEVEISEVSPYVHSSTGTALTKFKVISKNQENLFPGTQGQVKFKVNSHSGFLIPTSAVFYKEEVSFVRIIEEEKVKELPVTLGKRQFGDVEILKGLTHPVQLVERVSRSVSDGEKVKVEK